jgi:hypothetical protein
MQTAARPDLEDANAPVGQRGGDGGGRPRDPRLRPCLSHRKLPRLPPGGLSARAMRRETLRCRQRLPSQWRYF